MRAYGDTAVSSYRMTAEAMFEEMEIKRQLSIHERVDEAQQSLADRRAAYYESAKRHTARRRDLQASLVASLWKARDTRIRSATREWDRRYRRLDRRS